MLKIIRVFSSIAFLLIASAVSVVSAQTVTNTIAEVQGELFSSPLVGQIVTVQGFVTAASSIGYFIQDAEGPWNGVFIYDNTNLPVIGDDIIVQGEVEEYFDNTEIFNITYFETVSSGNVPPAAAVLGTGFIGTSGEPYEGCLVRIVDAVCTTPDADFGQGYFNDSTGDCMVDDLIYVPDPAWVLNEYYSITGVLNFSFDEYKIEPRDASDVSIGVYVETINPVTDFTLFPNPTVDQVRFNLAETAIANIYDMSGRLVFSTKLNSGHVIVDVSRLHTGNYRLDCVSENGIARSSFVKQ